MPAESEDQDYLWTLNFGPQHPATHTTLRLILTLDGETVVKAVPDIGYLHSGFEKLGEDLDYNQYVTIVDRMNYISPIANEIAWLHSVEKLMGIELTPRCKYIRVILGELARISDHLLCVGAAALDLGAFTAFLYALLPARDAFTTSSSTSPASASIRVTRASAACCTTWATTLIAQGARLRQAVSQGVRRHVPAAQPQPHLHRSHRAASACCRRRWRST